MLFSEDLYCYTSCTMTTLKYIQFHFYSIVPWKDILNVLPKCEGCTHFCEILYIYIYINTCVCVCVCLCVLCICNNHYKIVYIFVCTWKHSYNHLHCDLKLPEYFITASETMTNHSSPYLQPIMILLQKITLFHHSQPYFKTSPHSLYITRNNHINFWWDETGGDLN